MRALMIIQNTDIEPLEIEELILAKAQLKTIDDEYQSMKLDPPEWVLERLHDVSHEISQRVQSQLKARLRNAKARREALRTNVEKRKDLDAEIKELEGQLA